jgi:hypothetical protein
MKTILVLAVAFLIFSSGAKAQQNNNHIGLRAGESSGIDFKHLNGTNAFEFIVSAWPNDLTLFGLFEKYKAINADPGFSFYYGAGPHVAFNTYHRVYYYDDRYGRWWYHSRGGFGLGIDGIVGLEYAFRQIPLALTVDLKPYIEFNTDHNIYWSPDPGLGIKVTF